MLHLHKRLGIWMQPGGHIDAGETPTCRRSPRGRPRSSAWRSRTPRSGPRLIHLDVHEAALGHTHLDLRYLLIAGDDDPHPPPGESPDARWCSWDEAIGHGRRGVGLGAAARPGRMGSPRPRRSGVSDTLDHLLAVQDLDTSITQMEHRRDALPETSGPGRPSRSSWPASTAEQAAAAAAGPS